MEISNIVEAANDLVRALSVASDYPRNHCGVEASKHSIDDLLDQLNQREEDLFGEEPCIDIVDVQRDLRRFRHNIIEDAGHLEHFLKLPFDQRTRDPKQRFVFISAPHSRAALNITRLTLLQLFTFHQVAPVFLDFVFPFGNQHYVQDFYFGGFRSESCRLVPSAGLTVPSLGRSGRHLELCYNLKSVEKSSDNRTGRKPWIIRQCSIQHRFDLQTEQSIWHIIKANNVLQRAITKQIEKAKTSDASASPDANPCPLAAALETHLLIAEWSASSWHWYINDLEVEFQNNTRSIVDIPQEERRLQGPTLVQNATPTSTPKPRRPRTWSLQSLMPSKLTLSTTTTICEDEEITPQEHCAYAMQPAPRQPIYIPEVVHQELNFRDLQTVQRTEDKANQALLILEANANVLGELSSEYDMLLTTDDLRFAKECKPEIHGFYRHITRLIKDLNMQKARMETLRRMVADRKALLQGLLQYRSVQASRELAERAQQTATNMERMTEQMTVIAQKTVVETVSMRIITVVTLFFLPGTFISTLMSTDIVHFDDAESGFGGHNIGSGALELYLAVSLPLMCFTFLGWYYVYLRERKRQAKMFPQAPSHQG